MKMARVILFTSQIDAMSKFYGEVLGLKKIVTNEKGWQEFAAGGARIALHSGPSSPGRKGPKIVFHARTLLLCVRRWWRAGQLLARSDKGRCFACAMARTQTAIPFNCPTVEN